jgi:hypothetical protein
LGYPSYVQCGSCIANGLHQYSGKESRNIQQYPLKVAPTQLCYSPDAKSLLYAASGQVAILNFSQKEDEPKPLWKPDDAERVCHIINSRPLPCSKRLESSWFQCDFQSCRRWYHSVTPKRACYSSIRLPVFETDGISPRSCGGM